MNTASDAKCGLDWAIEGAHKAEEAHEVLARGSLFGDNVRFITREFDAIHYLDRLKSLSRSICTSWQPCTVVRQGTGKSKVKLSAVGDLLLRAVEGYEQCFLSGWKDGFQSRYKGSRLHPRLQVMVEAIQSWHGRLAELDPVSNSERFCDALNELAAAIRTKFASDDVKRQINNFERNAKQKLHRALNYTASLFQRCSRLLVVRVDLYARRTDGIPGLTDEHVGAIDEAFDRFADDLARECIVKHVVGWMSAREQGHERGRHFHVLVAMDGNLHREGVSIAKMLGEYWKAMFVDGQLVGTYFNCFGLTEKYKHLGIGMVHRMDGPKLVGLFFAIRYLCKTDVQWVAEGVKPRNFRRGQIDAEYVRRGRPRSHDDNLLLVHQTFSTLMSQVGVKDGS